MGWVPDHRRSLARDGRPNCMSQVSCRLFEVWQLTRTFRKPVLSVQKYLPQQDVAVATAVLVFAQYLGSSIYLTAADTLLNTELEDKISSAAPTVNASAIIAAGATAFRKLVPSNLLAVILEAYADCISDTFYIATGLASVSILTASGMWWRERKARNSVGTPGGVKRESRQSARHSYYRTSQLV